MTRKAPLYASAFAECPADYADLHVYLDGVHALPGEWLEVDVLGCWGVRYLRSKNGPSLARDDDGCFIHEKVYGNFVLEYQAEPAQEEQSNHKPSRVGVADSLKCMLETANFDEVEKRILAYFESNPEKDESWSHNAFLHGTFKCGGSVSGRWTSRSCPPSLVARDSVPWDFVDPGDILPYHEETAEVTPRQIGKVREFAMGYKDFAQDADVYKGFVDNYRKAYPQITKLWQRIDEQLKRAPLPELLGDHMGERMLVHASTPWVESSSFIGKFRGYPGADDTTHSVFEIVLKGDQLFMCKLDGTVRKPPDIMSWHPVFFIRWEEA